MGAAPTGAAISFRLSWPSFGQSLSRVLASTLYFLVMASWDHKQLKAAGVDMASMRKVLFLRVLAILPFALMTFISTYEIVAS